MFVRPRFLPKLVEQFAPGEVLGHYRIAQKIGEGGMGEVYRARDEHLGRDVAIKVRPSDTLADQHARKRFRKEADALSKLNHPNIATIYDFDTQAGVDFLVMEYIPGETLSDKLGQEPMPEKEVVRLGLQLVEGLAAAHEQGVIHRDLKPGNLRLTTDERLKILDFGLAKLVRSLSPIANTESSLDTVVFAGTLPYVAPEQLRGAAGDIRTDIYSAGVVLYELATGRLPFPEKLATALADDILHQAPPPPGRLRPKLSARLEDIILKCLEKEPENRYQSAKELAIDLRRLVAPSADPQQVGPSDLQRLKRDTDSSESAVLLTLKRPIIVIPVAAVLLIAAVLFAVDAGGLRSKLLSRFATEPQIRSLAVLPLANLSGDPQQEYFADGMTEELITELSRIPSLKIISRTSVMQYKGEKKKPLSQIGRELRVDAVMEGSVLRSGDRVRIAAHVIYAPTDQSLMAETYEADLGDVLRLQREVADSITEKVRARLTPEQQSRLHEGPKVDSEAYEAYLAATYATLSHYQENKKAQVYLQKAIQKDPNFALAYGLLARTYIFFGEHRWRSPQEVFPLAKQAAGKALELDEKNCSAHEALGEISWRYDWDWQTAEKEFLHALELCPNSSNAHWDYGFYTASNGRITESQAEAAKLRELDPIRSEPVNSEAIINYHLRNYKALIEVSRAFTASSPNNWLAHYWLGVGFEGSGQTPEAIPEYQRAVELSQGDSDATASLAHAYATTGRRAEAEKILHQWLRQSDTSFVSPYMIATVYAGLGDKDRAFEFLEKAYQIRSTDLPYFLRADLRVDSLRSDPRFQDLKRRINFPQ